MKQRFSVAVGLSLLAFSFLPWPTQGVEEASFSDAFKKEPLFKRGSQEIQFGAGAGTNLNDRNNDRLRPKLTNVVFSARWGFMLTEPHGESWRRGNWQLLAEAFGGPIVTGPGDALAGGTVILRYNFIPAGQSLLPYVQLGAGGIYSNAAREDRQQRLLGSELSFNLRVFPNRSG